METNILSPRMDKVKLKLCLSYTKYKAMFETLTILGKIKCKIQVQ